MLPDETEPLPPLDRWVNLCDVGIIARAEDDAELTGSLRSRSAQSGSPGTR